ncbi:3D domain-containing protein [Alicyclobacillus herbarius]|uniref:3D domain-containing protein n=1 Tax=Alicyclobacillus herbarius TaxID=122960 RepID=UPI0009D6B6D1|nr:3D domain-containing protein [Alicyclobacillus herbarius]
MIRPRRHVALLLAIASASSFLGFDIYQAEGHPYAEHRHVEAAVAAFASIRDADVETTPHQTLDDFTLTAYALDPVSTGKRPGSRGFGVTASGTRAQAFRTIAVDPSVIPIGSYVYIEGLGWRVAEDTGGAIRGRHIDVLLPSRKDAIQFGVRRHVRIYILPRQIFPRQAVRDGQRA